jgi:hypothetical protein
MAYRYRIRPNLIDPVPVKVEQLLRGTAIEDPVTRELVGPASRAVSVNLEAQVSWGPTERDERAASGAGGRSQLRHGYLVFRKWDLDRAGVTLAAGDRVTQIGAVTALDIYLYSADDSAHHYNARSLEVWRFEDRAPTHLP